MIRRLWWLVAPGVATPRERWLNRGLVLAVVLVLVCVVVAFALGSGLRSWAGVGAAAGVVAAMAFRYALERAHLRALELLRDAQFLVCPGCRYGLHASIREGRCPECGDVFDAASLRREWTERYVRLLNRVASPEDPDQHRRRMNPWL